MQAEALPEALRAPENTVPGESTEPKSKRGGKRAGAGRKPNLAKLLLRGFSREAIAQAVATVDVGAVIIGLLKSKRERTRIETLVFVRDTLHGRPAQNVQLTGSMLHAHTIWRPLETLTDEELRLLDSVTKKLTAPVSDASPDTPQNQMESKPAIEAEVVDSEAVQA